MYPSANYVLFVNFEDFQEAIINQLEETQGKSWFFSGYDCDSLAYEPVTGFVENFLPFFKEYPKAILELRTKSTNIKSLLKNEPIQNCVVAFSFTPDYISKEVEHKVPNVQKRIEAMGHLAKQGWKIGLRLDPLIYKNDFEIQYSQLIKQIFSEIHANQIHSVSVGPMRFPVKMFQKIVKLYPQDKLLAQPLEKRKQNMSYAEEKESYMKQFVLKELEKYMSKALIFECNAL
jgi:spore photoproduct lyase